VVELAYTEAGQGRPLVLLHAFPLSQAMWSAQREALSAHCRVVTPDLRGFGDSPLGSDDPSLDASADDVAALLDALGLDRVTLGGLSMGGYVAMAFLRRHADRVDALLLADTKAGADPAEGRARREWIAQAVLADPAGGVLLDEVLPTLVGSTTVAQRPAVVARVRELVQAAPAVAVAWAQRAMAARPDSIPTLRDTGVPALVVVGEEDTLSPPADGQAMVEALPAATLVCIPAAGHLSAVEQPEQFNAAVTTWLTGRLA